MATTQAFCLRRNNHPIDMIEDFEKMFKNEDLVDVSLSCEDGTIRAHKVILSACSSYFRHVLSKFTAPFQYPVLIIKDMPFSDLKAIIEFIYRGEVTVPQEQLNSVLKSAEALKVKGLVDVNNQKRSSDHKSKANNETDGSVSGEAIVSCRKRRKRRRKASNKLLTRKNENNSDGEALTDDELTKEMPVSTDATEYSDEETILNDIDSNTRRSNQSPSTDFHQHLRVSIHPPPSAISVISSEGDIEPSRLLEQTMITGDAHNIESLQSLSPMSTQVKQMMYDESSSLMPHLSAGDQSSMNSHGLALAHFEQANALNSLPGPSSLSQLIPRSSDDNNYSHGSLNGGGGANGLSISSTNLLSPGNSINNSTSGTSLIPLQMAAVASQFTNGSSSNSSSSVATAVGNSTLAALNFESHYGRRNYQCPVCFKSFTEKGNMKRHTQVHLQQRNRYMCEVCSRCFAWKDNFNRHRRIAHSDYT